MKSVFLRCWHAVSDSDPRTGRNPRGIGACGRCKTGWDTADQDGVKGHATRYCDGSSCFPLCETCWRDLTPEQRLPYYRELFETWADQLPHDYAHTTCWPAIEAAVKAGL